jgi:hypothetical protein
MTTWWLLAIAVFLLILDIGGLALLTGSPAAVELVMGVTTLAVGSVLSAIIQPWQWFERRE